MNSTASSSFSQLDLPASQLQNLERMGYR